MSWAARISAVCASVGTTLRADLKQILGCLADSCSGRSLVDPTRGARGGSDKRYEDDRRCRKNVGVSRQPESATRALKRLQALARQPPSGERSGRSGRVPEDVATEELQWLVLNPEEEQARLEAQESVAGDLRFEYLDQRAAAEALWRFVCRCVADRATDHVGPWVKEYAREILERVCYLPVEHLQVESEVHIAGLRLLPTTSDELPRKERGFVLDPPVRCVVAVRVSGTSYTRMAERARAVAEHGLRVLRTTVPDPVRPKSTYLREDQVLPHLAAIAILHAGSRTPDRPLQAGITAPAQIADLIDQLRAGGVVLTYDPQDRTLRADGRDTLSITVGKNR
jgi:hypothetical protein